MCVKLPDRYPSASLALLSLFSLCSWQVHPTVEDATTSTRLLPKLAGVAKTTLTSHARTYASIILRKERSKPGVSLVSEMLTLSPMSVMAGYFLFTRPAI